MGRQTHGDLVPSFFGPFLGGELQVPILLRRRGIGRVRDLASGPECEFHSFQETMGIQRSITSSI